MSKEFDIDSFQMMEVEMLNELDEPKGNSYLVKGTDMIESQPMEDDSGSNGIVSNTFSSYT